jgi:hypothetical protein
MEFELICIILGLYVKYTTFITAKKKKIRSFDRENVDYMYLDHMENRKSNDNRENTTPMGLKKKKKAGCGSSHLSSQLYRKCK